MSRTTSSRKILVEKLKKDIGNLRAYWPKDFITLADIIKESNAHITLVSGELHEVDKDQLRKLLDKIPEYLWDLIKVPFTFRYEKDKDGRSWYRVVGDRWQRRALEILLYGKISSEGLEKLNVEEFRKLVTEYNSLIFVSMATSIT
jgi:uncharacterized protein (UPF0216 family)